ncbi:unnamed protein product [Polarella glacialis]|uniref:TerD domain-containing protein n=1 Tax=Polarella glacialis TaxID=89957 RepID=A0A813EQ47_POLGL|nr:unnamed protein product [Polarella glacialis]CAE8732863.1 unnamed protein product [Polarella glacialis]
MDAGKGPKVLGPRASSTSSQSSQSSSRSLSLGASSKDQQLRTEKESGRRGAIEPGSSLGKDKNKPVKEEKSRSSPAASSLKTNRGKDKKDPKNKDKDNFALPEGTIFSNLGRLKDAAGDPNVEQDFLTSKLKACCTIYDFNVDTCQSEKDAKRLTLLEILAYWPSGGDKKAKEEDKHKDNKKDTKDAKDTGKKKGGSDDRDSSMEASQDKESSLRLNEPLIMAAAEMVRANAFRCLLHRERTPMDLLDGEDEEPLLELTWPHLELVYELLLKILASKDLDSSMAQSAGLDKVFLQSALELFESDDPRERDALKGILGKFYSRLSPLRSSVRKGIQSFCLRAVYLEGNAAPQSGIAEVLDVLLSRVVGSFPSPLKQEHRDLFFKILLPLYKLDTVLFYHTQLQDLIRSFVKLESGLGKSTALALLKYWPVSAASKQTLFLSCLEDLMNTMPSSDFKQISGPVARQLACCVSSPNSEVAERALAVWRNDRLLKLTVTHCKSEMPTIVSALYHNVSQAWHNSVHSKTIEVLKSFMEADSELFDASSGKHRKEVEAAEKQDVLRNQRWEILQDMHDKKLVKTKQPVKKAVPAKTDVKTPRTAEKAAFRPSPRTPDGPSLARNEEVQLPQGHAVGLAMCWEQESSICRTPMQALVVTDTGKIVDAVHGRNTTAMGSALRLTPRVPRSCGQLSCCGTIWASFELLADSVSMILFTISLEAGAHLGDASQECVLVVDLGSGSPVGEIRVAFTEGARGGCVAILKRVEENDKWVLIPKLEFSKSGSHYLDLLEPTLGTLIRQNMPSLTKRHKTTSSFSFLEPGSVADLPTGVKKLFVSLGWDTGPAAVSKFTIDFSLVFLSERGKHIGAVSSRKEDIMQGVTQVGGGCCSSGALLDFDAFPESVCQIYLVAHVVGDRNTNFDIIQQPHCSVIDLKGQELARFMYNEEGQQRGVLMARFAWSDVLGRWSFQALGRHQSGQTWNESLGEMRNLVNRPLKDLQLIGMEDGSFGKGSSTTCGSEYSSVIIPL